VREGPLRHRLRPLARPRDVTAGEARRPLGGGRLGRGARRRRRGVRPPPRAVRRARQRQGHQRGRLPRAEVLPRGDGDQRRRPLHAPVPLALGRGDADLDGLRGHVQLVPGLRGSWLPDGGRRRCVVQSPGDHRALPPRGQSRRPARRRQSQARRPVRPGRSLAATAAGHRRGALQRDGARHSRRGAARRRVRPGAHRRFPRLAWLARALYARLRRARDGRPGRRHRPGRALVREASVRARA